MKIEYKVYCHEHDEEMKITHEDSDYNSIIGQEIITLNVKPCSQCMSEAYERGIESLLSKGWESK